MEDPEIEPELFDAYRAASTEHTVALRAWSAATHAEKKNLLAISGEAKIRLSAAYAAWRDFGQDETLAAHC